MDDVSPSLSLPTNGQTKMDLMLPNLFLVGAPKSGTTSLAFYLAQHENVFTSYPKEPKYFAKHYSHMRVDTLTNYNALYAKANLTHKWRLDASAIYMYLRYPIASIAEAVPDAQLLVMLRDPVSVVSAWHNDLVVSGRESAMLLDDAWSQVPERKRNASGLRNQDDIRMFFYDEIAAYATQLRNIYTFFPRKQVHVILFDQFSKDTAGCFREVCDFLRIGFPDGIDYRVVNARKRARSKILNDLASKKTVRKARALLGPRRHSPFINSLLFSPAKKTAISVSCEKKIRSAYKEQIVQLQEMLQIELKSWM